MLLVFDRGRRGDIVSDDECVHLSMTVAPSRSLNAPSDMERDEAIALVRDAIRSGIFNDLGSGSNVDICVISPSPAGSEGVAKVEYLRNYEIASGKRTHNRELGYNFARGTTPVLRSSVIKLDAVDIIDGAPEPMEE